MDFIVLTAVCFGAMAMCIVMGMLDEKLNRIIEILENLSEDK